MTFYEQESSKEQKRMRKQAIAESKLNKENNTISNLSIYSNITNKTTKLNRARKAIALSLASIACISGLFAATTGCKESIDINPADNDYIYSEFYYNFSPEINEDYYIAPDGSLWESKSSYETFEKNLEQSNQNQFIAPSWDREVITEDYTDVSNNIRK
jgi:hypothetical protein